ncbi:MAG: ABC transporter substrate-binding protein [Fervidobacterium sp.]|uniref:ABC transporter substrate-binding protein n=1 Tax=Fervidobacterium sp. TaxID=1871331 RepID=UPI0040495431
MKRLVVFLALLASIFAFSAVTIEFWTLSLSPTFDNYIKAIIADFEKENPGIKVNWLDIPYGSAVQKLTAAISARQAPDVVNLNTSWAIDFAAQEALLPLDKYLTDKEKGLFWEKLWNATVIDGKSYAIPWYASIPIMMYNREIFEKAGLDPNKPPKTWDEILVVSRIVKTKLNLYGFVPNIIALDELLLEGIPIVTPDGKKAAFNTPAAVKKLEFFQKAYRENLMTRTLGGYGEGRELFQAAKLAVYPAGLTMLKHIEVNSPSVYKVTDVSEYPVGKGGMIKCSLMNLVVPITTKYPAEAVKFAMYVASPRWQIEFSNYATVLPSTKQGLETSKAFVERAQKGDLAAKAMLMASKSMVKAVDLNSVAVHKIPADKYAEVRQVVQDYWMKAIKGEYTAAKALELAETEVNKILSRK